jgi:hypothetical protein
MEKATDYFKENWFTLVLYLVLFNWLFTILMESWGLFLFTVSAGIALNFLSKKVFLLHKGGPIPWYGSPIFYVSLVFILGWAFWYGVNT